MRVLLTWFCGHANITVTRRVTGGISFSLFGRNVRGTHDISRLLGGTLGALLSVDADKVRQGGTAGEQRGGVAAEEGQQDLFKQHRHGEAFDTADHGVRQLQRGGGGGSVRGKPGSYLLSSMHTASPLKQR